ncbi:MAG: acetylglutamate kinase [Sediminibacterium sp.]|nr:acetylglutamate kinase [Sediminibacterium sp.]
MKTVYVIKIGGNVVDDDKVLQRFLKKLTDLNVPLVLVHGGGKLATELSQQMNIRTKMVEGRRITDEVTLKVVTMVYAGWINKTIVAKLNALGAAAIGLCGADALLIKATRRKPQPVDYGFVGDIAPEGINAAFLSKLLKQGLMPVIAPITATAKGQLLNTNADTIASSVAVALAKDHKVKLIYCFEKKGVLNGVKVIRAINPRIYSQLKADKVVKDGMIPKLDNAFHSVQKGVKEVKIGSATHIHSLVLKHAGTSIVL